MAVTVTKSRADRLIRFPGDSRVSVTNEVSAQFADRFSDTDRCRFHRYSCACCKLWNMTSARLLLRGAMTRARLLLRGTDESHYGAL